MSIPDLSELEAAAKLIVRDASKRGELQSAPSCSRTDDTIVNLFDSNLSKRVVRRALEAEFKLTAGALDDDKFKDPLKLAISAAAENPDDDVPPSVAEERRPEGNNDPQFAPQVDVASANVKKRKSEEVEDSEGVPAPPPNKKKRKSGEVKEPKPSKKRNERPPKKAKKGNKEYKSSEMIASSDIEDMGAQEEDTSVEIPENQAAPINMSKKPVLPKASGSISKASARATTSTAPEKAAESDSNMSLLDDKPRKPVKKSKTAKPKDKGGDKVKGKKAELSKDEETIKRLKSLVLACGVRRVWAKVFKDVDKPSQQIQMLREILTELGMSGRMSLEQAKAIKARRELAKELEDVQAFAAAATRPKSAPAVQEEKEEDESSEEEELERPAKRKVNARRSIMEFLGDQSDDD
ncbi:hypothetical protein B0H15DRAFT_957472 [Mycena belliarum]|uniref:Uncharacterized protein n=1 Tax=Mycena belliarum TaxID=1033014 RepID=A0AAD6TMS3_9AGAR|nr:hypothetical protein B0H15DRAFT_957472 [Mycena belliae]